MIFVDSSAFRGLSLERESTMRVEKKTWVVGYIDAGYYICTDCARDYHTHKDHPVTLTLAESENAICAECFGRLDGDPIDNPHNMAIGHWWTLSDYTWIERVTKLIGNLQAFAPNSDLVPVDYLAHMKDFDYNPIIVDDVWNNALEKIQEFAPTGFYVGIDESDDHMGCWPINAM